MRIWNLWLWINDGIEGYSTYETVRCITAPTKPQIEAWYKQKYPDEKFPVSLAGIEEIVVDRLDILE